jgi:hypothetical protein
MVDAYIALYQRLLTDCNIAERVRNKLAYLSTPTYRSGYSTRAGLAILRRLLWKGILPGGPRRMWYFVRSLPFSTPSRVPTVISDWIVGLSMREFAGRNLTLRPTDQEVVQRRVDSVRDAIGGYLASGKVTLSLHHGGAADVALCVKEQLDQHFFRRAAPALERLLKHTCASLTLRLDALHAPQLAPLQDLLRRLARYGDRISIIIDERLRGLVSVDSSVFKLVLARSTD